MSVILPNATIGVAKRIGEIMSADGANGVLLFVQGDVTVLRTIANGEKSDVAFGEKQTEQMAAFFKAAADTLSKQGGSGLPPTRTVVPTLIHQD